MNTVLVVDDDRTILGFCTCVLAEIDGLNLLQAAGGNEAITVAGRHNGAIDVLLSDMVMPGGLSGCQLATKLLAVWPDMRVVLMSGMSGEDTTLRAGWFFLSKPFRPADLTSKVEEALGRRPPARASNRTLASSG